MFTTAMTFWKQRARYTYTWDAAAAAAVNAFWSGTVIAITGGGLTLVRGPGDSGGLTPGISASDLSAANSGGRNAGKLYAEFLINFAGADVHDYVYVGVVRGPSPPDDHLGSSANVAFYRGKDGLAGFNGSFAAYSTFGTGDLIGMAFDIPAGKMWFHKNGIYQRGGDPALGISPTLTGVVVDVVSNLPFFYPAGCVDRGSGDGSGSTANFGSDLIKPRFAYHLPKGFRPWNE